MTQKSRWTLPEVVNPPDSLCFTVNVPNERYHIAAFLGAIYELAKPYSWQNDALHTAIDVGAVWRDIFYSLAPSACETDCPVNIEEMTVDMSVCEQIRYNPATGLFEGLCCGSWSAISGQPANGFAPSPAPGPGTTVPKPGACTVYQGTLRANEQWLCPAVVNTGDTVQITFQTGAWTDGSGIWYGSNSTTYFGGIYVPNSVLNGADPLPASPHMGLLSKINGAFHYLGDGAAFTVPAGVSNKLLILQANDASLTDDSGQITFSVTVCNNQSGAFHHTWDFTVSNWGWSTTTATWVAGVGWQSQNSGGNQLLNISKGFPSRTITRVEDIHNAGAASGGGFRGQKLTISGVITTIATALAASGTQDLITPGSWPASTVVQIQVDTSASALVNTVSYVAVDGIGVDPF